MVRKRAETSPSEEITDIVRSPISTQVADDTFTYYANHAEISCTAHEFAILFARIPAKLPPDKLEEARAGALSIDCDVQILISPTLISGLIRALITQKETYEKRFGIITQQGETDADAK
jgi:hypothetical protein